MKTGNVNNPLPPDEYREHLLRLYECTEDLYKLLKKVYGSGWIDIFVGRLSEMEFIHRSEKLKSLGQVDTTSVSARLQFQQINLGLNRRFAYSAKFYDPCKITSYRVLSRNTYRNSHFIGLYFPPEQYPMVDGKYPTIRIKIEANDNVFSTIQLDGTNRIYKPIDDLFWCHVDHLWLVDLLIYTGGKPFWRIDLEESCQMKDIDRDNPSTIEESDIDDKDDSLTFNDWTEPNFESPLRCISMNLPNNRILTLMSGTGSIRIPDKNYAIKPDETIVFDYPYVSAANKIKREWIRYRMCQKRKLIGAGVRGVFGIGVDYQAAMTRHINSDGKFII